MQRLRLDNYMEILGEKVKKIKSFLSIYIQKVSKFNKNMQIRILDLLSPFVSWVVLLFAARYWVSRIAKKTLSKWQKKENFFQIIGNLVYEIFQPEKIKINLFLPFTIVFLPQLIITIFHLPITGRYVNGCVKTRKAQ